VVRQQGPTELGDIKDAGRNLLHDRSHLRRFRRRFRDQPTPPANQVIAIAPASTDLRGNVITATPPA